MELHYSQFVKLQRLYNSTESGNFSIQLKLSLDLTLSDNYIFHTITIPKRPLNIILYVAYTCRIVETNYINLRLLMLIINAYILFILVFFYVC